MNFLTLGIVFAQLVCYVEISNAYYSCTRESLDMCLGDMVDEAEKAQTGAVPSYTPEEFTRVCGEYSNATGCLAEIKPYCSTQDSAMLEGFNSLFQFLCGEGFEAYVRNSDCFLNEELNPKIQQCLATYQSNANSLLRTYGSANSKMEKLCEYTNKYVSCSSQATRLLCNDEAGDLIVATSKHVLQATFESVGFKCTISSASSAAVSTVLLVFAAVLTVLKNGQF